MKSIINIVLISLILISIGCSEKTTRFVIIPDTQSVFETDSKIWKTQMEWIADSKNDVDLAIHVGDITQRNSTIEWEVAHSYFSILMNKVPFAFALGNHDMGSAPSKYANTRKSVLANNALKFALDQKSVVSTYPENAIDNMAQVLTINGEDWLVISLEFGVRDTVLEWANDVVSSYPNHQVIINTHAYTDSDSTRISNSDRHSVQVYGIGKNGNNFNDGEDIWNEFAKKHSNVKLVFSGHICGSGVGTLVSKGEHGNDVCQMLANYQRGVVGMGKGGNGYMRIIDYSHEDNTYRVKTYSPWLDEYLTGDDQEFDFILN